MWLLTQDNHAVIVLGMDLKTYLRSLVMPDREDFARRCETTLNHLKNVAYRAKPCSTELAMLIERESGALVKCEESCPHFDWSHMRNSANQSPSASLQASA